MLVMIEGKRRRLYPVKETTQMGLPELKIGCIEFKYYADAIHSGLTPPG